MTLFNGKISESHDCSSAVSPIETVVKNHVIKFQKLVGD